MFTVVLTEQEHLDSIGEYKTFLKPFLDNSNIAFCRWLPEGDSLVEAVPELYNTVSRHERWRLILVCDEEGLSKTNPFDLVDHKDPVRGEDMEEADYLALRRQARIESYTKAARKPMTRLMTWLCQPPLVTRGMNNAQDLDAEFAEYLAQTAAKEDLRAAIIGDSVPEVTLPAEVICLARRCCDREERDLQTSWSIRQSSQYSRFYDYNLYFDKMRYLVFDILPKNHRNYTIDYIRFLYAVMLLAQNETPMGALAPNRVYTLDCRNDEAALSRVLGAYDAKLAATQDKLRGEMHRVKTRVKPRLSDRDAEAIFCSKVTIPVTTVRDFDHSSLYVSTKGLGLSTDCPDSELVTWSSGYQASRRAMNRYLKTPRRAIKKATSDLRRLNRADLDEAARLNEFQIEDVTEYVDDEELKLMSTRTCDLYDMDRYVKTMEEQNKQVQNVIERRMTRKWTIALSIAALVCYLLGFVPMFLSNLEAENGTWFSVLFVAGGLVVMALTAFVSLFFLRLPLRKAFSNYNGTMKTIINDVEGSLGNYSKYLSHACNIMRGNSVLNFCSETEDPDIAKLHILKKHELDVQAVREELREIFGIFLPKGQPDTEGLEVYSFDFYRPVDYDYAIPFATDRKRRIEFLQKGNLVEVPVDFVKSMSIRREELYD